MNNKLPIIIFIVFGVILFPLHVDNYIYINSRERYASINVVLYRLIKVFNINTIKNSFDKMQVNGKDKKIDAGVARLFKNNVLKIYNNITFTKMIQLGDYGIAGNNGAYVAVTQHAMTQAIYSFVVQNGGRVKLKNYIVFNKEHDKIIYYAKISGVINLLSVMKIILVLIMEKFI